MPKQTEVKISYSLGAKLNMGNYEMVDIHVSESETWSVEDLPPEENVETLSRLRYEVLKERVSARVQADVDETRNSK